MTTSEAHNILFIGLGAMGKPMASRLTSVGFVAVSDLDFERASQVANEIGASVLEHPRDGVDCVDIVSLSLPGSGAVESVLLDGGVLEAMKPGSIIVDLSSSSPSSTIELAQMASRRGVAYVDAPVSGGVPKATSGELSIMVGAESVEIYDSLRWFLGALGTSVVRTGSVGTGHALKSLNNMLSAIGLLGASEILAAAVKFGIEPGIVIDVINNSTGRNQATEVKFKPFILSGTYNAGFALDLMLKDVRIALDLAEVGQTPHALMKVLVESISSIYEGLSTEDLGIRRDHTEVARWVSKAAEVVFEVNK